MRRHASGAAHVVAGDRRLSQQTCPAPHDAPVRQPTLAPDVHVSVDRRAKYDAAAAVLFAVQRGGLKRIGFVADENGGL